MRASMIGWIGVVLALLALTPNESAAASDSRTEDIQYHDDTALWVLGQVKRTTCVSSSPANAACDGGTDSVMSQTDYGWKALPWNTYEFGVLRQTLSYETSASGQVGTVKTVADGNGNLITVSNWKRGVPQSIKYPATPEAPTGATQSATVSDQGWITAVTDENGYKTCYGYDAMGRINTITYPSETQAGVCDESVWAATSITFAAGNPAAYGLPAGHWRQTTLTGDGRKITMYDALWRPVVEQSLDLGNVNETTSVKVRRYDHEGRETFRGYPVSTLSNWASTSVKGVNTQYDALGRVQQVKEDTELSTPSVTTLWYGSNGNGAYTKRKDPRGAVTYTWHQAFDQPGQDAPVTIWHPEGAYTHITRDPFGKPTKIRRSDSSSATGGTLAVDRTYTYDAYQRLCRSVEPETGATLMGYDTQGNLTWSAAGLPAATACHATGSTTAISARRALRTYDARNRVTSLSFPDNKGNTTHTYWPDGQVKAIVADNGDGNTVTTSYNYNRRRLPVQERMQWGTIDWSVGHYYDANGHLSRQVLPGGLSLPYAPNALGQPTQVSGYATGISYFPNGAAKQFTYGNGIVHSLTQNARGLADTSKDAYGSTLFHSDSYDYDQNANVLAISDGATGRNQRGNRDMVYDQLNRLTSTTSPMFGTATYTYNVLDDLTRTKVSAGTQARDYLYCYGSDRTLAFIRAGSVCSGSSASQALMALGHDEQGNLETRDNWTFDFDYGNRLRGASQTAGPTVSYVYDGLGRRVRDFTGGSKYSFYSQAGQLVYTSDARRQRQSWYMYLGSSLVAIRERNTTDGSIAYRYQHTDALGSPVLVTDANRNVEERSEYEPYGQALRALRDGPGFTGHVEDAATGLTYMQQRYYDPSIGRFLSVDPVTAYSDPMGAFNRYWYAGNNPYTFTDPDGRDKKVAWLVRLTANGMQKVARLTREQAISARRAEQNVLGDRRQVSSGIEKAAHGTEGQLKHAGHELKDGSKGLPHYQTEGKAGHTFWGQLSVAAASVAGALNQVADAAEYIPDPGIRPATQDDIDRTNNVINTINNITGSTIPNYGDVQEPPPLLPPPKPEEPKPDPRNGQ